MNISVEELTVLVMAHELAHAYSHLGSDAAGHIWSKGFPRTDIYVKEGIAQYYTWAVAAYLDEHHYTTFLQAYERKIEHQRGPYVVHVPWIHKYSLEVFRQAIIEVRSRREAVDLACFVATLEEAKARVSATDN
jgi:hypothetical protein